LRGFAAAEYCSHVERLVRRRTPRKEPYPLGLALQRLLSNLWAFILLLNPLRLLLRHLKNVNRRPLAKPTAEGGTAEMLHQAEGAATDNDHAVLEPGLVPRRQHLRLQDVVAAFVYHQRGAHQHDDACSLENCTVSWAVPFLLASKFGP